MKRRFAAVLVVVLLTITSTFANNNNKKKENVNQRVESTFNKTFGAAQEITWTKVNNLYKAQFILNGHVTYAFLDEEGVLVGAYRNILSTQLPIQLMTQLKDEYADYWISNLFEMAKENETSYYVTVENGTQTVVLKSENGSKWQAHTKVKK
jgi:hypothetical protein